MADSKISALSAITSLADTDEMVVASSSTSKKITGANLKASVLAAISSVDATLSGDVTIVNANTFYDGPSASLVAGTWLIVWKVLFQVLVTTAQTEFFTAKLWDGTTIYDEMEVGDDHSANLQNAMYPVGGLALVTLASTKTMKVSGASVRGSSGGKLARDVSDNSGTSHTATRMTAIKIA